MDFVRECPGARIVLPIHGMRIRVSPIRGRADPHFLEHRGSLGVHPRKTRRERNNSGTALDPDLDGQISYVPLDRLG